MDKNQTHRTIHALRVVTAFALGGAITLSLGLGWVPVLAAVDLHAVGAALGGALGVAASFRNSV
jgi:hypothetical protein